MHRNSFPKNQQSEKSEEYRLEDSDEVRATKKRKFRLKPDKDYFLNYEFVNYSKSYQTRQMSEIRHEKLANRSLKPAKLPYMIIYGIIYDHIWYHIWFLTTWPQRKSTTLLQKQ